MQRFRHVHASLALALITVSANAHAIDQAGLERALAQRLEGDRSGACIAAAVIDGPRVVRAHGCTDPARRSRIEGRAAFEIGSVTKTMTAALLATLIERGEVSLDDPLASLLPAGTAVPGFEGQPILLRHVVTHTSGLPALPSRMRVTDPADPYAALDEDALLGSLADVRLAQAPGTQFAYSNFASMVLSWGLARQAGIDFESLLQRELLAPLAMRDAHIRQVPDGVRAVQGHLPGRQPTKGWTFPVDMAGVGGVRATLDDMVRYAQAQLGQVDGPVAATLARTQQPVRDGVAMNWMIGNHGDRRVHGHEGGTGGFSSLVAFDREGGQAVVLLSDTALHTMGGLRQLGMHLLGVEASPGTPRRPAQPPSELLDALAGDYLLEGAGTLRLSRRDDTLRVQAAGQPELALGYDDAGEFHLHEVDAVLRPQRGADGRYGFVWVQGGGALRARPLDPDAVSQPMPAVEVLRGYAGTYPLMPGFELDVRERDGGLYAQATGQGEFALEATAAADVFAAPAFGIEIRFQRASDGAVVGLELHQGGNVMRGERR
ncbi:serine hydrolase [Luteimonas yindakuii]|uniref:serine hydrolase n=1 Tax=Luteimonas yindakuii TaxID=2565782 RepID=UPI0011079AD5|nr:serine hydrolase [Luteimonas yindakuii]QCU72678.1 serine hydrolase [Luteimonas yindakuii]